jgi:retron-type reverse transcriptase
MLKLPWGGLYRPGLKRQLTHTFNDIISIDNLLLAWPEFLSGKKSKRDVQEFGLHLMDNILTLHEDLQNKTYVHGGYYAFNICDPKPRSIHKASVRDRLLHHAVYRILYPFFDKTFIADSFSCRLNKGMHKGINRFRDFAYKVSKNHTRTCWALKCDIRKFFANIDHSILLDLLRRRISDKNILWLLERVIVSFSIPGKPSVGLPLGNLTSQLLVNIYMNEFDQFMKHRLKARYYIRYADDFVILSESQQGLENLVPKIAQFLIERLRLTLHPDKLFIKTVASGVDFLGWIHFPDHRVLRTASKQRMLRHLKEKSDEATVASYRGLLQHGNAKKLAAQYLERIKTRL